MQNVFCNCGQHQLRAATRLLAVLVAAAPFATMALAQVNACVQIGKERVHKDLPRARSHRQQGCNEYGQRQLAFSREGFRVSRYI